MTDKLRLDAIEEKIAHLERALSQISDVVIRQQRQLEQALERQQRMNDRLALLQAEADVETASSDPAIDEKPPHY